MDQVLYRRIQNLLVAGKYSDRAIAKAHNLTEEEIQKIRLDSISIKIDDCQQKLHPNLNGRETKLTFAQAKKIRIIYSQGLCTQQQIASRYQVSKGLIHAVIVNKVYIDKNYQPPKKEELRAKPRNKKRTAKFCLQVKQDYLTKNYTFAELSHKHGCCIETINKIINDQGIDKLSIACRDLAKMRRRRQAKRGIDIG